MKVKKALNILFVTVCAALLLTGACSGVFTSGGTYSPEENRMLAAKPEFSLEAYLDGRNFDAYEDWLKDSVPFRTAIMRANTALDRAAGKPAVNGIYEADDALLPVLSPIDTPDSGEIAEAAERYSALAGAVAEYGGGIFYAGVKGQITALSDRYPSWMCSRAEYYEKLWSEFPEALEAAGVTFISGAELTDSGDYMKTDHHLTLQGAYKLYAGICRAAGVEPLAREKFSYSELSNPFYGSRGRRLYGQSDLEEKLCVFDSSVLPEFDRTDGGEYAGRTVFSVPDDPDATVTYDVYMGGDVAECVIDTGREELPDILIFGDSYTNAVECYLPASFGKVYSFDLRYYDGSLIDFVRANKPDVVVCLRDDGAWMDPSGNGSAD